MLQRVNSSRALQKGAILLEALIAVVIFSFGILALAGLQSLMIKNTDDAKYRAEATFIAQQKLGEIWTNAQNFGSLADYIVDEPVTQLPNGNRTVVVSPERVVTVSVSWQLPGSALPHTYSTNARIEGIE
ncbi:MULTISPECIES: type IV pilus modification PilV family protein [Methylotenera]|uniref:type IV pilus modification PilV family protein n=1 Tax=Methylotenera TaxID=359407 RepID=UPI00039ADCED|nr:MULTISPECIES: prepilin-type cleavage/methylation domain-containing protein [Methylotenera]